jgi:hypothetical protein
MRSEQKRLRALAFILFVSAFVGLAGCSGGGPSTPSSSTPSPTPTPTPTPSPPAAWNFIGPEPMTGALPNFGGPIPGATFHATGRVTALAVDPSGQIFLGATGGGVWTSTDGGSHWTSIEDALPTQAVGAMALDPRTSPTTVYVATGENNLAVDSYYGQGVFESTDLGVHWTRLTPVSFDRVGCSRLAIDTSKTPVTLFAACGVGMDAGRADPDIVETNFSAMGLWHSVDGGTTWTQYPASDFSGLLQFGSGNLYRAFDVAIDPANPSQVYAAIAAFSPPSAGIGTPGMFFLPPGESLSDIFRLTDRRNNLVVRMLYQRLAVQLLRVLPVPPKHSRRAARFRRAQCVLGWNQALRSCLRDDRRILWVQRLFQVR